MASCCAVPPFARFAANGGSPLLAPGQGGPPGPLRSFVWLAALRRSFAKPDIGGILQQGLARRGQLRGLSGHSRKLQDTHLESIA